MEEKILFYGEECDGCQRVLKEVEKLLSEGIRITLKEVWHNKENMKLVEELDTEKCDGVPFFINTVTKKTICGAAPYEIIKAWALGEPYEYTK